MAPPSMRVIRRKAAEVHRQIVVHLYPRLFSASPEEPYYHPGHTLHWVLLIRYDYPLAISEPHA